MRRARKTALEAQEKKDAETKPEPLDFKKGHIEPKKTIPTDIVK